MPKLPCLSRVEDVLNGPRTRVQRVRRLGEGGGWGRHDGGVAAGGFGREGLVHNKRLRVAWVALDDVADPLGLRQTHRQGRLEYVSARHTSEEVGRQ